MGEKFRIFKMRPC